MSIYETIGAAYTIFATVLATIGLIWGAFHWMRQLLDDAKRGVVERQRDVVEASRVREALTK